MAAESNSKIVGLVGLLVVAVGLLWWLGRDDRAASAEADGKAAVTTESTDAPGSSLVPKKALRGSDFDPLKAPRAEVTGTVRDQQGQPIAGAQVCAKLTDYSLSNVDRTPPRCVTTREDGTYRLDDLLGTEHNLFASAVGFIPVRYKERRGIQQQLESEVTLKAGATRAGVDFVLEKGGVEVKGVVKDIAGGVIEGAWISCSAGAWDNRGGTFTRSDENGSFTLWTGPLSPPR